MLRAALGRSCLGGFCCTPDKLRYREKMGFEERNSKVSHLILFCVKNMALASVNRGPANERGEKNCFHI